MKSASELLASLASRLGLSTLEPTDEGLFVLLVDQQHMIFLRLANEDSEFILFSGIGTLPVGCEAKAMRGLLEANNFWVETGGFNLSLIPATSSVLLTARTSVESLEEDQLFELFDRFVTMSEYWRERLPQFATELPSEELDESISTPESESLLDQIGKLV